jgi:hypothetical protein
MKETIISVPTGTFPAVIGDRIRISLHNVNGLETVDAVVREIVTGCGASDKVKLRYDETLLPFGLASINKCVITGFQKLCSCCSARPCMEVFAPTQAVVEGRRHVMILPGDYRLDAVKFYSPFPEPLPLTVQVTVGGVNLFPHALLMDDGVLTATRAAFAALFSSGLVPAGTVIEVNVVDAPQELYYEAQWHGLTFCLLGIWYPHAKTAKGSLQRTPGVRPVAPAIPEEPGSYPYGTFVVDGDGNFVDMGDGTLVTEGEAGSGTPVDDGAGSTVVDGGGSTVIE